MSQLRKSTRKKRQTQLSFSPLLSSSPAASQYPEQIQRRAASVRYDSDMSPSKKRRVADYFPRKLPSSPGSSAERRTVQVVVPSPSRTVEQLPTPAASSQAREEDREEDDGDTLEASQERYHVTSESENVPILRGNTTIVESVHNLTSGSEDPVTPVRSRRRVKPTSIILSSEEDSDTQVAHGSLTLNRRSRTHQGLHAGTSDASPGRVDKKISLSPDSKSKRSEDILPPKTPEPLVISSGNEDTSSEDDVITPARRRVNTANVGTKPREELPVGKETQELDEDVADLEDTVLRQTRTRGRQDTSERSKRQRKLNELRQRRAGKIPAAEEDEEDEEEGIPNEGSEPESEPLENTTRRGSNLDEYEEDFVDDEDDSLGVDLGVAGVPLHLTYHGNKKPFEHFKTEVEWMVHNKLNPAFERHDEIYLLAHAKLDKEVEQYGSAKFSSSVWKEHFVKALRSRPDFYRVEVPTMFEKKCDACNRSNHPPKYRATFTGKAYNRDTLETVEYDDDDDDDSHESSESEHEESFFLGRFCCANAEMAHALHHWRYTLNQTVLSWLAADGQLTPEKIVERANLRQKKRERASNKVVDSMEAAGVMKDLYRQFKENLEAARDAKPQRFSSSR